MNCANDLEKVAQAALNQFARIEKRLAVAGLDRKTTERNVALCLLDAHGAWSLFVRSFFISCFIGATRGAGGRVTATVLGPRTPADAIRWATVTVKPRLAGKSILGPLDEPAWHMEHTLLRLAQTAGFSNLPDILAASAVPGPGITHLRTARNFFAHRGRHTALALRAIGPTYRVPATVRPGEIPGQPHHALPGSIAENWLAHIIAVVRLLPR